MHIPHMLPQPDLGGEDLLAVRALFRLRPLMVCLDVLLHLPVAREVPGAHNALHPEILVDPPDVDIQGALVAEGEGAQLAVVVPHPFVHRPYVLLLVAVNQKSLWFQFWRRIQFMQKNKVIIQYQ